MPAARATAGACDRGDRGAPPAPARSPLQAIDIEQELGLEVTHHDDDDEQEEEAGEEEEDKPAGGGAQRRRRRWPPPHAAAGHHPPPPVCSKGGLPCLPALPRPALHSRPSDRPGSGWPLATHPPCSPDPPHRPLGALLQTWRGPRQQPPATPQSPKRRCPRRQAPTLVAIFAMRAAVRLPLLMLSAAERQAPPPPTAGAMPPRAPPHH